MQYFQPGRNYWQGVAGQLSAKVVVPMHYGTGAMASRGGLPGGPGGAAGAGGRGPGDPSGRGLGGPGRGFSLGSVDEFLKVLDATTKVVQAGHTITLTAGKLPPERTVMAMKYE